LGEQGVRPKVINSGKPPKKGEGIQARELSTVTITVKLNRGHYPIAYPRWGNQISSRLSSHLGGKKRQMGERGENTTTNRAERRSIKNLHIKEGIRVNLL